MAKLQVENVDLIELVKLRGLMVASKTPARILDVIDGVMLKITVAMAAAVDESLAVMNP